MINRNNVIGTISGAKKSFLGKNNNKPAFELQKKCGTLPS